MENIDYTLVAPVIPGFSQRRGKYYEISEILKTGLQAEEKTVALFERADILYRTLCAVLYNFVPTSGHPGGSISSGRFVSSLIYNYLDFDIAKPFADENDLVVYAAGHKALGLYAMWALRNEFVRTFKPELLPDEKYQLRFEDLLGFRKNPTNTLPLFKKFVSKALDGHPTPATPHVKVATGASGVGIPSSFGVALGALDYFGENAPYINVVEGEGGMTPGRVAEAFAAASAMRLYNIILHIDYNQASIDSNRVCRDGDLKGDYVQWNPMELCYLHDFNVIHVDDGKDFRQIMAAQSFAKSLNNKMPTAIVYRTVKGWKYGIEGKASHGAGHKMNSEGYYNSCKEFEDTFGLNIPRLKGDTSQENIERCFYDTLLTIREAISNDKSFSFFADSILKAKNRIVSRNRIPKKNKPDLDHIYKINIISSEKIPDELNIKPGEITTLRSVLGTSLGYINRISNGAVIGVAADLLGSTSVNLLGKGFQEGFYDAVDNPDSRILAVGGICEDAIGGMMAGLSAFGKHIGVSSSYGAFISAMEHTAARLHGIGEQNKVLHYGGHFNTWILINAHAGLKTGEDGPTHADPQCLQLIQENFPPGILITITPWEPGEIWPLLVEGLNKRPAVLSPFVTRPNEPVIDRKKLNLAPATDAVKGVYALRKADESQKLDGSVILQESGVTLEFITKVLPKLDKAGFNMNIYHISSAELYDAHSKEEREKLLPYQIRNTALGITGFTLPTMYKWITSFDGRYNILHPFRNGYYLGSGTAESVLLQAGLDADSMYDEVVKYIEHSVKKK
ncbi:MAG: Transketolase 2 [Ignavibacteria bacterium]|nr:Transketolase 2 [Ignavibacteria bacterium]